MATLYHVCRNGWNGCDLLPLVERMQWSDETAELIAATWPDCDPWAYYCTEAHYVHLHETLAEAHEFAVDFGGEIVAVDVDGLDIETGREYPHPVFRGRIGMDRISTVNQ